MNIFEKNIDFSILSIGHKILIWIAVIVAIAISVGFRLGILNFNIMVTLIKFQIIWILFTGAVIISTALNK